VKELQIIISERAEKNLDALMEYLESEWSARVKEKFRQKLLNTVKLTGEIRKI